VKGRLGLDKQKPWIVAADAGSAIHNGPEKRVVSHRAVAQLWEGRRDRLHDPVWITLRHSLKIANREVTAKSSAAKWWAIRMSGVVRKCFREQGTAGAPGGTVKPVPR